MALLSNGFPLLIAVALFALQVELALGRWTFSLRISSARCNQQTDGSCDGLFMAVCVRHPETSMDHRENCPLFIAAMDAATLLDRELTSVNEVNVIFEYIGSPYVEYLYDGGIQLYIALLTEPDHTPPFDDGDDMVDELFVELSRVPGGGECARENVVGDKGHVSFTISLSVDCYTGYSGDNCSCLGDTTCAISSFACPTNSTEISNPLPSTSKTSDSGSTSQEPQQTTGAPSSTISEPLATSPKPTTTVSTSSAPPVLESSTETPSVLVSSTETKPNPTVGPVGGLNSTEESDGIPLVVPVATAGGAGALLLIIIVICTIVIAYRHRRKKKSYRLNLSHLMYDPKTLAPTIPPSDVRDGGDGVTYTSVVHSKNGGHNNMGYGEEIEKIDLSQVAKEAPPHPPRDEGITYAELDHNNTLATEDEENELHYAELDHDNITFTTFKKKNSWKRKAPAQTGRVQYVTVKRQDPHKYVNVSDPPRPKPRSSGQQMNIYSTVPSDSGTAPTN